MTAPKNRKTLQLTTQLSASEARRLVLRAQGLDQATPFGGGEAGVLKAFARLGYVQIDTISVVERAHHHVLWSRVPDYRPEMLHGLQAPAAPHEPRIFEYWAHAASYLPLSHYRFCLPRMQAYSKGRSHWTTRDKKTRALVLDRIRAEGPLQARDFEAPAGHKPGTWFEWKPAKAALEQLFTEGQLMIRERRGFQKVFDLTERVLPASTDTRPPTAREMAHYLITQALRSNGLGLEPEMRYLRRNAQKVVGAVLKEMEESGEVSRIKIEGVSEEHFALGSALGTLEAPLKTSESAKAFAPDHVRILSPFDNLVIQRRRLKRLFEFEYQIECYVPEGKRKHGYFVLPVLWGDRLAARIDAKADRAAKVLRIQSIHFERTRDRKELLVALQPELARFAQFNGCEKIE